MVNIKVLPPELQKVAETELGEVPSRVASDLQDLKTWIEQEPHLNARLDDQFLIQFLRGCKYSLEKAKSKIDLFFTLKSKYPHLFNVTDVNETKFKQIYSYGFGTSLPQPLDGNGARIYFMKFEDDVGKGLIDVENIFRVSTALHEIIIMDDPYACINGIVYVIDFKNITVNFAAKLTPSLLKKVLQFYENSLPLRIKRIQVINMPGFFQSVLNIILSLLSEKLRQRVFVYGQDYENVETNIPKKYLPTYSGGENGSLDQLLKDFEKKLSEYTYYFSENKNYGTNELLRIGKPIDFDSIYGLGGSFRKLDVD